MAMVDYPYAASFLGPLPAWPVHAACEQLIDDTNKGVDILIAFKNLAGILYNDTSDCFDIYAQFIEVRLLYYRFLLKLKEKLIIWFVFFLILKCADPTSCGLGNDAKAWDYQVEFQIKNLSFVHRIVNI
jgi:hypothetical protein